MLTRAQLADAWGCSGHCMCLCTACTLMCICLQERGKPSRNILEEIPRTSPLMQQSSMNEASLLSGFDKHWSLHRHWEDLFCGGETPYLLSYHDCSSPRCGVSLPCCHQQIRLLLRPSPAGLPGEQRSYRHPRTAPGCLRGWL